MKNTRADVDTKYPIATIERIGEPIRDMEQNHDKSTKCGIPPPSSPTEAKEMIKIRLSIHLKNKK